MLKAKNKIKIPAKNAILVNNLHPTSKLPITNKAVMESVSKVMNGEDCRAAAREPKEPDDAEDEVGFRVLLYHRSVFLG